MFKKDRNFRVSEVSGCKASQNEMTFPNRHSNSHCTYFVSSIILLSKNRKASKLNNSFLKVSISNILIKMSLEDDSASENFRAARVGN